jgi:hypothetical protein
MFLVMLQERNVGFYCTYNIPFAVFVPEKYWVHVLGDVAGEKCRVLLYVQYTIVKKQNPLVCFVFILFGYLWM